MSGGVRSRAALSRRRKSERAREKREREKGGGRERESECGGNGLSQAVALVRAVVQYAAKFRNFNAKWCIVYAVSCALC